MDLTMIIKHFFIIVLLISLISATPVRKEYKSDGNNCGYESCPKIKEDALNVHIVPHSHDDVGWLKTVDQYYYGSRTNIQRAGVQYIIDSVVDALSKNKERRFIQVETAFLFKWLNEQNDERKQQIRELINNGQLEIVGGGWSMNDEAAVHYHSLIDQFTYGLRLLNETFGECGRPKIGWQIDPFGHSSEMASIFANMGYDGIFFSRVDWRDKTTRLLSKSMEMIWQGSRSLGEKSNIFTSVLFNHYSAPSGYCFDILCTDEPIIDDKASPNYNYERKVNGFASFIKNQAKYYLTNNIIITMGDDFNFQDALSYFKNLDKLIRGFNIFNQTYDSMPINVFYSTPSCYAKAVLDDAKRKKIELPNKYDDFFPYATDYHAYWTGYFTSRPTSKRYERQANSFLQVASQLAALTITDQAPNKLKEINRLKEAVGIMQHHDAITGTEKQHVADDYARIITAAFSEAMDDVNFSIKTLLLKTTESSLEFNSCLLSNVSYCPEAQGDSFLVAMYNPLSRTVDEYVRIPVSTTSFNITSEDGDVPYQAIKSISDFGYITDIKQAQFELVFQAKAIPPLGFKLFYVQRITNSITYRIIVDETPTKYSLGNENVGIKLNETTGILESMTIRGKTLRVNQQLMYYYGASGDNLSFDKRASGAYIFRPSPDNPDAVTITSIVNVTVFRGDILDEVHQEFSPWAKQVIRVYKDVNYIEFDWLVGPININDNFGKEVISRFQTDIDSDNLFYTDSNGREMQERKLNYRATYNYTNEESIAGNYYPVTTRLLIKDKDMQFAVINDRSQGGTSLRSGQLELMLHRRLLYDDAFGVGEALNESQYGQGLVARGQHYVTFGSNSDENDVPNFIVQKDILQQKHFSPWMFIADTSTKSLNQIKNEIYMDFVGLQVDLPENVHILTMDPIDEETMLLRFEHFYEMDEGELSNEVQLDLKNMFTLFEVTSMRETNLGADRDISEMNLLRKNLDQSKESDGNLTITLRPMEIRTFLVHITWNNTKK